MHITLYQRGDRLGTNIIIFLAQILFAHKNNYIIKFINNSKELYRFYNNSVFVTALFDYIAKYNYELYKKGITDGECHEFNNRDYVFHTSSAVKNLESDYISYFYENMYEDIKPYFSNIASKYSVVPFDVDKTILVHLRLDDTTGWEDYDGSTCANYYKEKIANTEVSNWESISWVSFNGNNRQAPLSKMKLENIINKAKTDFPEHKVVLLTCPGSDTSFLDYEVIKNDDESLDLYLLTMCNVTILSRSMFSLSSLFLNNNKQKTYIPLWGQAVCIGLDTTYDKNDKSKLEYFY